jgi:2-polyprenyl-3-methyl-5-hydroxy-6-metoxy-1,4-benzoquinol methylase
MGYWQNFWQNKSQLDWWKRPAPEVLAWIDTLPVHPETQVLDLGCGLGRHAIAFAQAGFSVTATDYAESGISYLNNWAAELGLSITTKCCHLHDDGFPSGSFDIVLSYNVLYHGFREQFARAIEHVHHLLKPEGLFYFTCPSRRDGKYDRGNKLAPHTFQCDETNSQDHIHYFSNEQDLVELLSRFKVLSMVRDEGYWLNKGTRQFFSNWQVLAKKVKS